MINQRDAVPDKILVTENESKIIKQNKLALLLQKSENIVEALTEQTRFVIGAREKGASTWLSVLPLGEFGFHLNKGEFRNALRLWYAGKLPFKCPCGHQYNISHALNG